MSKKREFLFIEKSLKVPFFSASNRVQQAKVKTASGVSYGSARQLLT